MLVDPEEAPGRHAKTCRFARGSNDVENWLQRRPCHEVKRHVSLVFAATDALVPVVRTIQGLRGYGQRRLARLQNELDVVLRKTEAREEEHSVEIRKIVDLFPVFGELDKHAMEDLLLLFQPASGNPGDRVLRKGDKATAAYFISIGAVQVSAAGREILLGPGEFFGEMALLSGARRSANVTAIDFCQFFLLTGATSIPSSLATQDCAHASRKS